MQEYLKKLEKRVVEKEWSSMLVIADNDTFTRVYQSGHKSLTKPEKQKLYQSNVSRFANKQMARIRVIVIPEGASVGEPWVVSVDIGVTKLDDRAKEVDGSLHNWMLRVQLMKSDLAEKPFTLDFVKKLVKLTRNGVVTLRREASSLRLI